MQTRAQAAGRARDLLFVATPSLWPHWPFLPLVRRKPGRDPECGVLFDARGAVGLSGRDRTVFLTNLFDIPRKLPELLAMPREAYDTAEEVCDAGWSVD